MKKLLLLSAILLCNIGNAQTTTVTYTSSSAVISNPERGFYRYSSAHTGTYNSLNQAFITDFRLNDNVTLINREFRLGDYINSPISDTYLTNVQADFDKIRNAGLKCIVRFVYSVDDGLDEMDATKATMLGHILQLKPILQANSDIIATMQAGFIGAWGEWYSTSQADFGGYGYNHTDLTATNIQHRKDILNAILDALPIDRTVQVRYPAFKKTAYSNTALLPHQAFAPNYVSRIGHHNDCFLATPNDYGTYDNIAVEYPYLEQETKFVPMGGETCQLNSPRSDCSTAQLEMAKFHWSYLNKDYYPDVIDAFQADNCYTDIQKNLGYRFLLTTATFPQSVALGTPLSVTIKLKNVGYAAPFNKRKAYIVLKNTTTNQIYPLAMASDPRTWLGTAELAITENLVLPANLTTGNYKLYLSLPDNAPSLAARPEYAIRFANESVWESYTGYNSLNYTLNITNAILGVANNEKLNLTIYPMPANDQITVELDRIEDYTVSMYNSLGQTISMKNAVTESNKMTLATSSLSDGLYFIEFAKGAQKDVRKIFIKH